MDGAAARLIRLPALTIGYVWRKKAYETVEVERTMGIGTSIFLLAVGAILRYAVTVSTQGINLHAVGDILMIVGVIGILASLVFWGSWGGFGGGRGRGSIVSRRTVVDRDPYRGTVVERESEIY